MPITDRYGNALKKPEQKPSVQQSLDAWALLNELLDIGYPHNFQHEAPHISGYLYDISALIDKAYEIKREASEPIAYNQAHTGAITAEQFEAIWNDKDDGGADNG